MPDLVKTPLLVTAKAAETAATVLDAAAEKLRDIADAEDPQPSAEAPAAATPAKPPEPAKAAEPAEAPHEHGETPPPATRSRISNPKAAKKVRQRT